VISIWIVFRFRSGDRGQERPVDSFQQPPYGGNRLEWDCGTAVCAFLFLLAGESWQPWLEACPERGISPADLVRYFDHRGWPARAYDLPWDQLEQFFKESPNQPLLAHADLGLGRYLLVLGLVQDYLVVADANCDLQVVRPSVFLTDFSGLILHFPRLAPLPWVGDVLVAIDHRLRRLRGHR